MKSLEFILVFLGFGVQSHASNQTSSLAEELSKSTESFYKPDEACVRLCCESNCVDLTSIESFKNVDGNFKLLNGRPCSFMVVEDFPWEFQTVSVSYKLISV
jgi:hypothetical protein